MLVSKSLTSHNILDIDIYIVIVYYIYLPVVVRLNRPLFKMLTTIGITFFDVLFIFLWKIINACDFILSRFNVIRPFSFLYSFSQYQQKPCAVIVNSSYRIIIIYSL